MEKAKGSLDRVGHPCFWLDKPDSFEWGFGRWPGFDLVELDGDPKRSSVWHRIGKLLECLSKLSRCCR